MAWMFTKSQTGYLDEYWGLDSSGNCCPVHFNLTVQENIPALLKSLRIVQGIEQALEERLQQR